MNTASTNTAQTLLALDYGIKKMGMALGNTITQDARPFDILAMNNGQPDWENLLGIIDGWQIGTVVVGLPLNMDGSQSMLSKRAAKFARRLIHRLNERKMAVEVYFSDERLTSREARQVAWERGLIDDVKQPIDDISACLILNAYFDYPDHATPVLGYQGGDDEC